MSAGSEPPLCRKRDHVPVKTRDHVPVKTMTDSESTAGDHWQAAAAASACGSLSDSGSGRLSCGGCQGLAGTHLPLRLSAAAGRGTHWQPLCPRTHWQARQ